MDDELDPAIWNIHTATMIGSLVVARQHGYGTPGDLEACGCHTCTAALERTRAGSNSSHSKGVRVDEVRAHINELLATGLSRTQLAVRAGLDRTTIGRALRADVTHVDATTAQRLLAVPVPR